MIPYEIIEVATSLEHDPDMTPGPLQELLLNMCSSAKPGRGFCCISRGNLPLVLFRPKPRRILGDRTGLHGRRLNFC